jgi:hypothetical protein
MSLKICCLIAHVTIKIWMDENVQAYYAYNICTICHMQLNVICNLSDATKVKVSYMCHMWLRINYKQKLQNIDFFIMSFTRRNS